MKYPFDRWLAGGETAQIKWGTRIRPASLSPHQRLTSRIEIEIDAHEVAKRRGRGELATLLQIEDSKGRRFRAHDGFDLTRIPKDAKSQPLAHYQDVFLTPGDYTIAIATSDSETGDFSFVRRTLHVPALKNDALVGASAELPTVEFVRALEAPDIWFQPYLRGRLRLRPGGARPVHVSILMNLTPSERAMGSLRAFQRNMSVLVPALKLLAAMELTQGSIDVTLLDLARQKAWEQKGARGLDWSKMREPLKNNQPGVIDALSLSAKTRMSRYFRDRVAEQLKQDTATNVVIVLSAPTYFEKQVQPEPLNLTREENRKVFYLRYRPTPPPPNLGAIANGAPPAINSLPSDDLEHLLRPLDAQVLTAANPGEFRKALAAMLTTIGRM